jgi:thiol-disulfide isomerase/thioredoxin
MQSGRWVDAQPLGGAGRSLVLDLKVSMAQMNRVAVEFTNFVLLAWRQTQCHLAGILLVPVLLVACGQQDGPSPSTQAVAVQASLALVEGSAFPGVTLKSLSGENVPLQSLQGKMLVLNVWATWCPPCRREMPSLERLNTLLDPQRFAVLGLSTDGDELLATEFLSSNHISFKNYFDRNGKLAKQLGLDGYPETFLIAQDGTLVKRVLGEQDWSSPAMIQMLEQAYQLNRRTVSGSVVGGK